MNPNLFTLPVYSGVSKDIAQIGVPTKLLMIRGGLAEEGQEAAPTIQGSGLYVGRTRGSMKGDKGFGSVVWKGSGAVWEDEENAPTHMGKRTVIAGTLVQGSGVRDYSLTGQNQGDRSTILRIETGLEFDSGASEAVRKQAFLRFCQQHGAAPQPHGAFALAPEIVELSEGEAEDSANESQNAPEAIRLSSAMDSQILAGGGVSWGRRSLFFVPEKAGVLVKGAVPGVLFRVMNVGGQPELREALPGDLELWYTMEQDRVSKGRARRQH